MGLPWESSLDLENQLLNQREHRKNLGMDPNWTHGFAIVRNKLVLIRGPQSPSSSGFLRDLFFWFPFEEGIE